MMKKYGWILFSLLSFFILGNLFSSESEPALDLEFAPSDCVYAHRNAGIPFMPSDHYDIILHTISIVNSSSESIRIDSVTIEALRDGKMIQSRVLYGEEIVRISKSMLELFQGDMRTMLDLVLWTDRAVPPGFSLSADLDCGPRSALPVFNTFLSFSALPDYLRISVKGRGGHDALVRAERELKVTSYQNKVEYSFPLEGAWLMTGLPENGVLDHHRVGIPNEFGVDFRRVGPNGELYKGEGKEAGDYYGWGEKVLAAADGVVAAVNDGAVQKWSRFHPLEGESPAEFEKRFFKEFGEAMKGNIIDSIGGNSILIKHAEGEYSVYFHLMENSVRVKVGDRVKRGQPIAAVGNTGDSFEVHLHFQVVDSPDFWRCRSLPFAFDNIQTQLREPGRFVKPAE